MFELIKRLEEVAPRRGKNERVAARIIEDELKDFEVFRQKFRNAIPDGKATLEIDGKKLRCASTSLVSGKVEEKAIISSIHVSSRIFNAPNINFNPHCRTISLATFYHAPAITVVKEDVQRIINAEEVNGTVKVKKQRFTTMNLIVGNMKNPKYVVFAHYDSVLKGAIDNSSGVAILLHIIKEKPTVLLRSLFVFSGSEELSFERPIYWGRGYRVFEEEYKSLLNNAKRILVVDCVGFAKPTLTKELIAVALPLKNLEKWEKKVFLLFSDLRNIKTLWEVYHSELDTVNLLRKGYLEETKNVLLKILK